MRISKLSALAVLTAMFFAACGDDVTKTYMTNEISGMEIVASVDSLGKCTEEHFGEMKFASKENAVFVCADSAWKNVSAEENLCSTEMLKDSSGIKIICGGDSVGTIFHGKKGANGISCSLEFLDSSGYKVICGEDSVGVIFNGKDGVDGKDGDGCSLTDNGDGSVTQICGKDSVILYKAFCGRTVYDPDSSFCYEDSVVALCGKKTFDLDSNFCYRDSVFFLCGGKSYNLSKEFCDARDGQLYKFTVIGDQTWMAENLNYAYMPDSLSFCYNDSTEYCEMYGRLYTWAAAMDSLTTGCGFGKRCYPTYPIRGACPEGWHLPDTTEWNMLEMFVANSLFGGKTDSVGYALKSTNGWKSYNGLNAFDFGALPVGSRYSDGTFTSSIFEASFWSSTEINVFAYLRSLNAFTTFENIRFSKRSAISIRCIKNE